MNEINEKGGGGGGGEGGIIFLIWWYKVMTFSLQSFGTLNYQAIIQINPHKTLKK